MTDSTLNIEVNQDKAIRELGDLAKALLKAQKGGEKLAKTTKKTGEQAEKSAAGFSRLKATIAAAFSGAAIVGLAKTIASFETLEASLGVVFQSMERGAEVFKDIQVLAETTPFAIEDLTTSVIKLRAAGIEPTKKQLTLFSDTASVTTDAVGSLVAITDLFSRTTAGGLGLMDLNRLADRGIPVFDILQQKLGLARLEVVKFGRDAQGSSIILEALTEGLQERFGGASLRASQNLTTAISNLGDTFDGMLKSIGDAGALDLFKTLVFAATDAVQWFGENLDTVMVAMTGLATLAIPSVIAGVKALTLAMAANPIGLLVVAITTAVTALYHFRGVIYDTVIKAFSVWIPNAVDHTLIAFLKVDRAILNVVNAILSRIQSLGNKLIQETPDFLKGWLGIEGASFSFGIDGKAIDDSITMLENKITSRMKNFKLPPRPDFFGEREGEEIEKKTTGGLSDGDSLTGNRINAIDTEIKVIVDKQKEASLNAIEQLEISLLDEEAKLFDSYARRQFMVEDAFENEYISEEKHKSLLTQLEDQYQSELSAIVEKGFTERQKFAAKSASEQTTQVLNEMIAMTAGVAQSNKAMFEINKIAGIASATINSWQGASNTMAAYPFPLNVALAGLSLAAGFAQVSAIANTSFSGGGGASAGTAPSGAAGGLGAPNSELIQPLNQNQNQGQSGPIDVHITVDGTGQMDRDQTIALAESLRDLIRDGGEDIAA